MAASFDPDVMKSHFDCFDRAIMRAQNGETQKEVHPETGESISVEFGAKEIVLSTATKPAFYRIRVNNGD